MRIALATSAELPELCEDDAPLRAELARRGLDASPHVWTDGPPDCDLLVIRSVWDYFRKPRQFAAFLESVDAPIANPRDVLLANMDKRYLNVLSERGIRTVPTLVLDRPDNDAVRAFAARHGVDEVIVKPTISAGGWKTHRRAADSDLTSELEEILDSSQAMVQPFVDVVVRDGEWSLVYLGGEFSHAVLKTAADGEFRIQSDYGGSVTTPTPPSSFVDWGARVVATWDAALPYARVDAVLTADGPMLMELELIEPELFFRTDAEAPARYLDAVLALAG